MIEEKSWEDFRNTGLLWWINGLLHMFGWAICFDFVNGEIKRVYPARCKFRGFDEKTNSDGYKKVSEYMLENAKELYKEAID